MHLRFIEDGTVLHMQEVINNKELDHVYKATFYDLTSYTSFLAESIDLYQNFHNFSEDSRFKMNFARGANMYTFNGKVKMITLKGDACLVLIEQTSGIKVWSRRVDPRNDMSVNVRLYELSEASLNDLKFKKVVNKAEFSGVTLDISASGLCLGSNEHFNIAHNSYVLLDFSLEGSNDPFLLPAKLMREGKCPQTAAYKYDYGFLFLFDNIPQERDKLITALFSAKLAAYNRL